METIETEHYYHIFNRGIDSQLIFKTDANKEYFLKLAEKYFENKIEILAYCLMDNHFHFLIKILSESKEATQALSNLFNAYAKAFNKENFRTGSLFEKHFKRVQITDENQLKNTLLYIHKNPEYHKIIKNFRAFTYSSFRLYFIEEKTLITPQKSYVISLFDDLKNFSVVHNKDLQGFENLAGQEAHQNKTSKKSLVYNTEMKNKFYQYIQDLQDAITSKLEAVDGKAKFQEDIWIRPEGGGGRTRVIENGEVFEKGGVNISAVYGELPETMRNHFGVKDAQFFACGLSLVLHPKNPMVPTVHANWRYFEMYNQEGEIVDQWFGGGQDLTPYYLFEEDAKHFHQTCKTACDKHNPEFYTKYKERCDEYFYNSHRNEARGIGGLFFDYCKVTEDMSMENWFHFVTEVGNSFLEAYAPVVQKRKDLPYTKEQRTWQEIRRGRYVEFNLVHDKGTLFGLKTNGRIESILMSLPPHVQWVYNHHPDAGSEEEKLLEVLKQPKSWV